jgi:hypothetical protein
MGIQRLVDTDPIPSPVYPKRKDLGVNSLCVGRRIEAPYE